MTEIVTKSNFWENCDKLSNFSTHWRLIWIKLRYNTIAIFVLKLPRFSVLLVFWCHTRFQIQIKFCSSRWIDIEISRVKRKLWNGYLSVCPSEETSRGAKCILSVDTTVTRAVHRKGLIRVWSCVSQFLFIHIPMRLPSASNHITIFKRGGSHTNLAQTLFVRSGIGSSAGFFFCHSGFNRFRQHFGRVRNLSSLTMVENQCAMVPLPIFNSIKTLGIITNLIDFLNNAISQFFNLYMKTVDVREN